MERWLSLVLLMLITIRPIMKEKMRKQRPTTRMALITGLGHLSHFTLLTFLYFTSLLTTQ